MVLDTGQEKAPRILGHTFQGPMTHNGTAPSHYDLHVWTVQAQSARRLRAVQPARQLPLAGACRRRRGAAAPGAPTGSCESLFAK